ncbi:Na+/H+ antiporter subunit E [Thalassotalea agarivorans]|uniref:Multicomponent Na+:H+ antiporter subunit E n=1 Tax=Thalassotalea agarivorans TaxID=349064 RepID=A0A1I0F0F8_THASX|nr:Na+/H+ antiporter subunit E [Thalassotalea agarivorans]SET51262.1 multicomponent Na+:H+ antiporter subunit E [Thalassotalea agarivorans]
MNIKTVRYLLTWSLVLAAFWLLLSGFLKTLLLALGLVSVAIVVFLLHRMDKTDNQVHRLGINLPFLRYVFWLLGQIVISSVEVAKLVWFKQSSISPAMGKLPVEGMTDKAKVLYANSITLTPGTLSVDIDDNFITVHALDKTSISALASGDMAERAKKAVGVK